MTYVISKEEEKQKVLDTVASLSLSNDSYEISIKKVKPKRTFPQNRLMWMWFGIIADYTGYTIHDIHDFFIDKFSPVKTVTVSNETKEVRKTTSELTKDEFSQFLNTVFMYISTEIPEILLPLPSDPLFNSFLEHTDY